MALPIPANNTCDIYHGSGGLGGAPDVAGVPCTLIPNFRRGQELEHDAHLWATHVLLLDLGVDIRDKCNPAGASIDTGLTDYVYIPNRASGTRWTVIWVERSSYGIPADHKRAYIQRLSGNSGVFPTDNL